MDNVDSPGALVRPRPGRFEFGGEFIDGVRLSAAATFAAGAVLALEQARHLPPAVQVTLEPARQRYGWYIDRTAFGPDLYRDGRHALLRLTTGATVTAQQHLEACWAVARDALGGFADAADIIAVERMISGDIPLPCEAATWREPATVPPLVTNPYAQLTRTRGDITIEAVTATWDFVAFRMTRTSRTGAPHEVIINIPEAYLGAFASLTAAGRFDDLFARALDAPLLPTLKSHSQTLNAAFFDAIVPSDALLPRDRVGVGPGQVSAVRLGKVETPPPPPHRDPIRTGGFPWVWIAAAVGCVFLIGGALTVLGGDDLIDPTPAATATTGVAPQPPVVGPIRAVLTVPVTTVHRRGVKSRWPQPDLPLVADRRPRAGVRPQDAVLERPGAVAHRHLEPRQRAPGQLPPQRARSPLHRDR